MCEKNFTAGLPVATGNGTIAAKLTVRLGSGGVRFGLDRVEMVFRGLLCWFRGGAH